MVKIPNAVVEQFSLDEWREHLTKKYDINPDTINAFEDVAEYIAQLWASSYDEFELSGISAENSTWRI